MPEQKIVPYSIPNKAIEVDGSAGMDKGTDPRNGCDDPMGDRMSVENPIIWPRPGVGKEHGG